MLYKIEWGDAIIDAAASNPLCFGGRVPAIDFSFTIDVAIDGTYTIAGSHDKAPYHEAIFEESLYPKNYHVPPSWWQAEIRRNATCIYTFENLGFTYLTLPKKQYRFEGNIDVIACGPTAKSSIDPSDRLRYLRRHGVISW